ncbi:hypothetical protein [Halorubrum sp. GN12_10-3_MGM]|uniref:hypothetical protein n=1 Tax=Halorubrum sp. GN12_10-3_MGM TaxID=2518113 RepID=UPI0010F55C5A|nr:hypothetical protein [Halorubrum sp. GN12_10-3_MGM]TKX66219.1 hypothetical protein EXE47_03085 [Halorubrum sp. GN12_10-3_MGM]
MSTVLIPIIVGILVFSATLDWAHYYDKVPAFIQDYRESNLYWGSAFVGAIYGSIETPILNSPFLVILIFILPAGWYFQFRGPFGLQCKYQPIDGHTGLIDSFRKKKNIAEFEDDECVLPLEIQAGKHLENYRIKFSNPEGTRMFIDYRHDKIKNYDSQDDILTIKGKGKDDISIGVYLEDISHEARHAEPFQVIEPRSDNILTEVAIT